MLKHNLPQTALAAVLIEPGKPLECRDVPLPPLGAGDVLVQVTACSLCGSDLHTAHGRRPHPVPTILGHEIVGRIVAFGPGPVPCCVHGRPLAVGQRVTWSVCASCGECDRCRLGMPQKCRHLIKYGHAPLESPHGLSGGLADHVQVFSGTAIVPLPDSLSDTAAVPASCAVATAVAIVRTIVRQVQSVGQSGRSLADCSLVVLGAGMVGLSVASLLRAAGGCRLTLIDPVADRRTRAAATVPGVKTAAPPETIDESTIEQLQRAEPADGTRTAFPPDGFDVVVEASGVPASVAMAIELTATGGTCILAGSVSPSPGISFDPERIVRRQIAVHGVHNYLPEDLVTAVDHLASPAGATLADLAGPIFPIEQVNEAIERAAQPDALRVIVTP